MLRSCDVRVRRFLALWLLWLFGFLRELRLGKILDRLRGNWIKVIGNLKELGIVHWSLGLGGQSLDEESSKETANAAGREGNEKANHLSIALILTLDKDALKRTPVRVLVT